MLEPTAPDRRLRLVEPDKLPEALAAALAGGPPIAPLPPPGLEREQAMAMLVPEEPVEADAAVVVSTSGSTGHPKGVLLSARAIRTATAATHERLGGPGDWVLGLPAHYVAGLMVLARAEVAGTTAARVRSDLADLAQVTDRLGSRRYLSIVPTQLARALEQPVLLPALTSFDAVLVGGGPLAGPLADAAARAGVAVVTTYGMSETCGGCVYDGVPLAKVDVALDPVDGRVSIGGGSLFSGYRLRPDLTADAVRNGRLVTADRGRWADGRLTVLGRLDDVVVSGGMNVDLTEVERAVRSWPELGVGDVAVVGVPDVEWGTAVVAVLEGDQPDPEASGRLRAHLRDRLPAYAAPRALLGRRPLPRTSSGKIDRRRLVADLIPSDPPTQEPA
ncbi:AMP-binding protein [uncultured Friedmanniella sp.]|uniref:AMP-binding protein n=1 Tax=uncultured Friedmanniella sp. TaxID=335381 RepID=UPI0035CB1D6C